MRKTGMDQDQAAEAGLDTRQIRARTTKPRRSLADTLGCRTGWLTWAGAGRS
jgi:hypothetical protein